MAKEYVTDPKLLAQLNEGYITDPKLLEQLNAPTPEKKGLLDSFRGTPDWMQSKSEKSQAGWADQNDMDVIGGQATNPFAQASVAKQNVTGGADNWRSNVGTATRIGAGVAQGAVVDPARALAQMVGADEFANSANQNYEKFRKNMGGEGFDFARLAGNVVSPAQIKGAQLLGKVIPAARPIAQGISQGTLSGVLNPVEGDVEDGFWSNKALQAGIGGVTGGAFAKLFGPSKTTIAQQSGKPLAISDVEKYQQAFGNRFLTPGQQGNFNALEQKATSWPIIGELVKNRRMEAHKDWNLGMMNKVLGTIDEKLPSGTSSGHDSFNKAYEIIGKRYDKLLDDVHLPNPNDVAEKVKARVVDDFDTIAPDAQQRFLKIMERDFANKFKLDPKTIVKDDAGKIIGGEPLPIDGRQFKEIEERMKQHISDFKHGTADERKLSRMLGDSLEEIRQGLTGNTADISKELKSINKAYAQYKILEDAGTKGASEGIFTPTQVLSASRRGNKGVSARGKGLLQEEAELANRVLGVPYPDSGTAGRLSTLASLGLVGGGSYLLGHAPALLGGAMLYTNPGQKTLGYINKGLSAGQDKLSPEIYSYLNPIISGAISRELTHRPPEQQTQQHAGGGYTGPLANQGTLSSMGMSPLAMLHRATGGDIYQNGYF